MRAERSTTDEVVGFKACPECGAPAIRHYGDDFSDEPFWDCEACGLFFDDDGDEI